MTHRLRRRRWVIALLVLTLVTTGCVEDDAAWTDQIAGGLFGLFLGAEDDPVVDDDSPVAATLSPGETIVEGEPLPSLDAGIGDPAVGLQAPRVTGAGFDRQPVVVGDGGGPTAIVFLAHWCPHCQAEVPRVQTWLDTGGGVEGVEIISVATAIDPNRPNYPPVAWLEEEGWTAPVLVDDERWSTFETYGGTGFPFWVFLDASGKVVRRTAGELEIDELEQFLLESIANA